jgi:hypothetical protein
MVVDYKLQDVEYVELGCEPVPGNDEPTPTTSLQQSRIVCDKELRLGSVLAGV